ncbi:hypothetical protein [Streptomyces sp. NPDC002952]|uniref:hypothetical protein n=1 Tax=Streptomyces sp. NPDC002952 TaxID=3364673 RepID=UPI00369132E3
MTRWGNDRVLVDEGRRDLDALTTADIVAAADIAGADCPDGAGMAAVRIAVDALGAP